MRRRQILLIQAVGLAFIGLILAWPSLGDANGIANPAAGSLVRGTLLIQGVADHPAFAKWQLDLLPDGDAERATFLSLGREPVRLSGSLVALASADYPDGPYALRLRVVRRDGNYDEFLTPISIANQGLPEPRPPETSVAARGGARRTWTPSHTASGEPILYLTFDDGPHPGLSREILAVLEHHGAHATFFVVGNRVSRWPEVIREAVDAGHTIANHGQRHKSLRGLDAEAFAQEVLAAEEVIREALGADRFQRGYVPILRPAYGHQDENTEAFAASLGYRVLKWDLDSHDWQRPGADVITSQVMSRAYPGAIVILHDAGGGSSQTVIALDRLLEGLSAQGYRFHSLDASNSQR